MTAPPSETLSPAQMLDRLFTIKAEIAELEEEKNLLSELLTDVDEDDLFLERDGRTYKAIVSVRTNTKVNLLRLQSVNPELFKRVTKPVLDTASLRETLDAGLWTPTLVDECVTFTQTRPSVRFDDRTIEKVSAE